MHILINQSYFSANFYMKYRTYTYTCRLLVHCFVANIDAHAWGYSQPFHWQNPQMATG